MQRGRYTTKGIQPWIIDRLTPVNKHVRLAENIAREMMCSFVCIIAAPTSTSLESGEASHSVSRLLVTLVMTGV